MTEFIIAGRGAGKTHAVLEKMLDEPDLYYISHSARHTDDALRQCVKIATLRGQRISPEFMADLKNRFVRHRTGGMPHRRYVIDNVEHFLAQFFHGQIVAVTATGTVTTIRPVYPEGNHSE